MSRRNPWSALLIGSCFERKAESRAVARRAKDGKERALANLDGVDADLRNMRRMLIRYPEVDVFDSWLQRSNDSKASLLGHVRNLKSQDEKKYFMLYYSGHGTSNGDWVLNSIKDGKEVEEYISLQEIIDCYGDDDGSKKLLIVSDCCYSGNWVDQLRERDRSDIRMMASCEATETCNDTEDGGVFTTTYIEACQRTLWPSTNVSCKHLFGHEFLGVGCIFLPRVSGRGSALLIGCSRELKGVCADLQNMSRMLTDSAKIDIYESWLLRRREPKQDLMACMRAFFSQEGKSRFVLYYSGHGTRRGDWPFYSTRPDGHEAEVGEYVTLKLQEIIGLWDELFERKSLYRLVIIADCSHSGAWVDELNELERGDIAMNASCQAEKKCGDTPEGGHFTSRYIEGCKGYFAGPQKWLKTAVFLSVNTLTLGVPLLAKNRYYSRVYDYQPVCTNTKSDILPLFDSFTETTLGSHWIA